MISIIIIFIIIISLIMCNIDITREGEEKEQGDTGELLPSRDKSRTLLLTNEERRLYATLGAILDLAILLNLTILLNLVIFST